MSDVFIYGSMQVVCSHNAAIFVSCQVCSLPDVQVTPRESLTTSEDQKPQPVSFLSKGSCGI